jgi:hypothetical protein
MVGYRLGLLIDGMPAPGTVALPDAAQVVRGWPTSLGAWIDRAAVVGVAGASIALVRTRNWLALALLPGALYVIHSVGKQEALSGRVRIATAAAVWIVWPVVGVAAWAAITGGAGR